MLKFLIYLFVILFIFELINCEEITDNVQDKAVYSLYNSNIRKTSSHDSLILISDNYLVSRSKSGLEVLIWDLSEEEIVLRLNKTINHKITRMVLLKNGDLATGCFNGDILIWDLTSGQVKKHLIGHTDMILSLSSLDNQTLASSSLNKQVYIWNIEKESIKFNLTKDNKYFIESLVSLENMYLVGGSIDQTIIIWNATDGEIIQILIIKEGPFMSLKLLPNSDDLACASYDGIIVVLDMKNYTIKRKIRWHLFISSIDLLPNGDLISTSHFEVKIWNVTSGFCKQTIEIGGAKSIEPLANNDLAFEIDYGRILVYEKDSNYTTRYELFN
jgi:WD40 repeat protein